MSAPETAVTTGHRKADVRVIRCGDIEVHVPKNMTESEALDVRLLTAAEAAYLLSCSRSTVYRKAEAGIIPHTYLFKEPAETDQASDEPEHVESKRSVAAKRSSMRIPLLWVLQCARECSLGEAEAE